MPHKVEIIAGKSIHQDGIVEVSTSFLEEYFNVTRKTLTMWAEKGCPKLDRGAWDFIAVLKWRGGLASTEEDKEDPYTRKIRADAFLKEQQGQLAEIELQKARGEIIEIGEVVRVIGGIISNTKALLMALPTKAAPRLVGLSQLEDLRGRIMERAEDLIKAKDKKAVERVARRIMADLSEAAAITEIHDVLASEIHRALEELSGMDIHLFEGANDAD